MRLIDADALIETVKDVPTYGYVDHGVCSKWDDATWTASEIVKEIKNAPTIKEDSDGGKEQAERFRKLMKNIAQIARGNAYISQDDINRVTK